MGQRLGVGGPAIVARVQPEAGRARERITVVVVAAAAALVVIATANEARAGDARDSDDVQNVRGAERARDESACARRLAAFQSALEADGTYASRWRDTWLTIGASLVALNLASAFTVSGYRRTEGIVIAAQSALLMIQEPVALTTTRALGGLRAEGAIDPCHALGDAQSVLAANADDAAEHTSAAMHVAVIALPIVVAAVLAATTGHFDFVGNGNEGATTLVAAALGELQVLTYPRPSAPMAGTSLTVAF